MKILRLKLVTFLLLLSSFKPATAQLWEILNPLPQGSGGYRGHFLDDNNGWVFRTDLPQLLRTRDGGNTWTELYPMTGMRHIFMADTLVGYMIVQEEITKLYKSIDGGNNWTQILLTFDINLTTRSVTRLHFIDNQIGFLLGQSTYYRTIDGGISWTPVFLPNNNVVPTCIAFIEQGKGWIATGQGYIFYTEDYGESWERVSIFSNNIIIYAISLNTQLVGIATGTFWGTEYGNTILHTMSNFHNFFSYNFFVEGWGTYIGVMVNDSDAFYCGLYNGGKIYSTKNNNYEELIEEVDFTEHTVGYNKLDKTLSKIVFFGHKVFIYKDTTVVSIAPNCRKIEAEVIIYYGEDSRNIYFKNRSLDGNFTINVISLTGQFVVLKTVSLQKGDIISIDKSAIHSTGVYLLKVKNNTNQYLLKFIKH
jgi:photosystem II stability/assembly factor-like uncharacterized protein